MHVNIIHVNIDLFSYFGLWTVTKKP